MCLITDDPEYKKDKEPIIVYKIIVKTLKECPVRYRTPFTWHIVTLAAKSIEFIKPIK